jgi:acetyl-CoA synthetase
MQNQIFARLPELSEYSSVIKSYEELNEFSLIHPDLFWAPIARARIDWIQDFQQACNTTSVASFNDPRFQMKWFLGGKLNVAVNCVDRHLEKNADRIALIWEKDEPGAQESFTYR